MKQTIKRIFILFVLILVVGFFLYQVQDKVLAEQSGSSPESGVTSRIKTIYDSLVTLTHGSDSAGGWGDWGVMWNRIRSAAEWVPTGDATEADVANGKLFYKDSRTQKTGTASLAPDYRNQEVQDYDDCRGNINCTGNTESEDSTAEEATWTNTAGSATTGVWKDTRTDLYWSADQGEMSNSFTLTQTIPGTYDCPFFGTIPSGTYAGGDSDCGTAINYCAALNLASGGTSNTDWFLPSQKVLFQAYIDGMLNQTNSSFALTDKEPFWSSTETSGYNGNPGIAWAIALYDGSSYAASKPDINRYRVRCVRRD